MAAIPVLALAVFGGVGTASATTGPAANPAANPATCTGTIDITHLAFTTPTVTAGQTATADLTAVNCTAQPITATAIWYGRFISASGTGIPPGCPVIDPIGQGATFAPYGTYKSSLGYLVFASCTATALQVTVTLEGPNGLVYARATAQVTIIQPTPTP